MRSYNKERLIFSASHFIKQNKFVLGLNLALYVIGFALSVALFDKSVEYVAEALPFRSVMWCVITALISFLMIIISVFSRYFTPLIPVSFILLGVRAGKLSAKLYAAEGINGIFGLLACYYPVVIAVYILSNILLALLSPYFSSAPKCKRNPNLMCSMRNVLKYFLIVFAVAALISLIFSVCVGSIINLQFPMRE